MLQVENLVVRYGGITALAGISFVVNEGEVVALVGANGAGKTSTMRALSGLVKPREGSATFLGRPLFSLASHERVRSGLAQSPEGRMVFGELTVRVNLELGAFARRVSKAEIARDLEEIFVLFPRLRERSGQKACTLSGGEQQMLAIGRALMAKPRLLLLDEPSLGIAPILVKQIFERVQQLNLAGMTVLLAEQNARMALRLAHRAYVLETGRVVRSGAGVDLLGDPQVQQAYLGGSVSPGAQAAP